jgi:hypothetical protein
MIDAERRHRRDDTEDVVDIRPADERRAHRQRAGGCFDLEGEPLERGLDRNRADIRGARNPVRHDARQIRRQLLAPGIVDVDNRRRAGRQHLEQPPLGREVLIHVDVKVEVIARQVCEDGCSEPEPRDSLQHERVRRDFHRAGLAAVIDHVAQESLNVRRFRCRVGGVMFVRWIRTDTNRDRAHAAARESRRVERRGEQVG